MDTKGINTIDSFDYSIISTAGLQKRRQGNQGRKNDKRVYKDLFCAFDIETTNDTDLEQAYMYIWQFQIEDQTIIGRTWMEFKEFLRNCRMQLKQDEYLMIYVHNLSFEFSFLKGIYNFKSDEVFSIESRKVLRCTMWEHFEIRCSYLLTNMNLDTFTKKMGVTHKLSGEEFDYSKKRYPWTDLTDKELQYCITDVKALVEALKVYFDIEHDNFYTIPFTSTGFVRRDVKRAMRHYNRQDLFNMQPDYEVFKILREAFRGGNTHANRYYSGRIMENITSYDRVSSYPDVQINELFPMSPWIREENVTAERACRIIFKHKRAALMRVGFSNIRLKNPLWGCPYIPKHKCRNLGRHYNDNGRILWADWLEISLCDPDLKIIMEEYDYDSITFYDFYHCRYGRLPKPLREEIQKFYRDKTELKGVQGQELFYMLQKAKLNSIYGMSCQMPVKQTIDFIDGYWIEQELPEEELLSKNNAKAFLVYSWGVWTTAHARMELEKALNIVGPERFVYCDTDSVKFIDDGKVSFNAYNESRKRDSIKNGGVAADPAGHKHYLGVYENEGTYKRFITMGAKKYAYEDAAGELHITVAGVSKNKGAQELAQRGGLEAFKEGFVWYDAGGLESVYNDDPEVKEINIDGHKLQIISNVLLRPSTYTLGITGEYARILENNYCTINAVEYISGSEEAKMYKYVVLIKDRNNKLIESVGTNNKFYAKWLCDVETREQGHKCEIRELDEFEEDDIIL